MKTRRNRSAQQPSTKSSARTGSAAARGTPQTGWSSLPDEVACAVLALSSADGFGNAGSVCKRFGRLVSTGAVTVARARAQTRHTWLICVGGCGRALVISGGERGEQEDCRSGAAQREHRSFCRGAPPCRFAPRAADVAAVEL